MTTYTSIGTVEEEITNTLLRTITFSGTVHVEGIGAARKIIGVKKIRPYVFYETMSDASGNWTLDMPGGSRDEFRIICVGLEGENSGIYEHLQG